MSTTEQEIRQAAISIAKRATIGKIGPHAVVYTSIPREKVTVEGEVDILLAKDLLSKEIGFQPERTFGEGGSTYRWMRPCGVVELQTLSSVKHTNRRVRVRLKFLKSQHRDLSDDQCVECGSHDCGGECMGDGLMGG